MLSSTNNDREAEEEKGEAEAARDKGPDSGIHLQNSASSPTLPKGGTNTT